MRLSLGQWLSLALYAILWRECLTRLSMLVHRFLWRLTFLAGWHLWQWLRVAVMDGVWWIIEAGFWVGIGIDAALALWLARNLLKRKAGDE
jgi:hypothetical protein